MGNMYTFSFRHQVNIHFDTAQSVIGTAVLMLIHTFPENVDGSYVRIQGYNGMWIELGLLLKRGFHRTGQDSELGVFDSFSYSDGVGRILAWSINV